jgi:hypothetical protein
MGKIIAGFPGVGKSYIKNNTDIYCHDSDSSVYSWKEKGVRNPDFPNNYIKHIKEVLNDWEGPDYMFVSTHAEVREALKSNGLPFTVVYPAISLKAEYMQRYIDRGSPKGFIDLMSANWEMFIKGLELEEAYNENVIKLEAGQTLFDVVLYDRIIGDKK